MLTQESVFEKIRTILSKSVDIDESDIKLESLLFKDFNIESTETLEITFRIEQEFNFAMEPNEFWNIASFIANEGLFTEGFSEEAVKLTKENFNLADDQIKKLSSPFDIYGYITVNDLVNYVLKKAG